MYSGIQIIIPLDNVIVNTYETALRLYNARYKSQLQFKEWSHINPSICFGEVVGERLQQMLECFTLYDCTTFYPNILDSLEKLIQMGFKLIILLPSNEPTMYDYLVAMFSSLSWSDTLTFITQIQEEQLISTIYIGTDTKQLLQTQCRMQVLYKQPWSACDMPIMYTNPSGLTNLIFQNLKING